MAKRKKKPKQPAGGGAPLQPTDPRELTSLLTYGPHHVPYASGWTANRVEQARSFRHWVYVAVHRIASEVAAKTPNVSTLKGAAEADESPGERYLRSLVRRQKALTPLLSHQGLKPVRDGHPLVRLFNDPNEPDVSFDLWYETVLFLLLTGTFYWWVPRHPTTGLPEAIWVLPSHWVWPVWGKDGALEYWELRPTEGGYYRKEFPADEVIVGRWKNPVSKIDGQSPAQAVSDWVDTQDAVNRATNHAYKNGITPTVAIQFDGSINDPTSEQLRRIEQKFLGRLQGVENSNRPLFLPPGVKVVPLSLLPNQMVFGDTAERTRDNILAAYAVPALVAGVMKGMTYGSILAAQTGFYAFAVNPLLRFLGQLLTEKLARAYDPRLRVWWEDFTPIDPQQRNADIKTMGMFGAISPNEIRIQNGFEPWADPAYDDPLIPANMVTEGSGGPGGWDDPDARNNPEAVDLDEDNKAGKSFPTAADPTHRVQVVTRDADGNVCRVETDLGTGHKQVQVVERDALGNIARIETSVEPLDAGDPDPDPA